MCVVGWRCQKVKKKMKKKNIEMPIDLRVEYLTFVIIVNCEIAVDHLILSFVNDLRTVDIPNMQ